MADDIDWANNMAQRERDAGLAAVRRAPPTLPPTGRCYNCDEGVPAGARFCDSDCRDDYEKMAKLRRQNFGFMRWDFLVVFALASLVVGVIVSAVHVGLPLGARF